jgi:hypothetical protein
MRSRITELITTMPSSSETALRWFFTRPLRPVAIALSMSPELTLLTALPAPAAPSPSPAAAAEAPQPMDTAAGTKEKTVGKCEIWG